eukprot:SAG11_NODE_1441_length_4903_cov_12.068693_2_plen_405_part_00
MDDWDDLAPSFTAETIIPLLETLRTRSSRQAVDAKTCTPPHVGPSHDGRSSERSSSAEPAAKRQRSSDGQGFVFAGVKPSGFLRILELHPEIERNSMTTSDVCNCILKPATTPDGWTDVVQDDGGKFVHRYHWDEVPGVVRSTPPPGTRSYADVFKTDPKLQSLVGFPTMFLSHAWSGEFAQVVRTLQSLGDENFVWFDCLVLDQHASYDKESEWWRTTFYEAIKKIGHTVMILTPWEAPRTLTRAWRIWELYCTIRSGVKFSIMFAEEDRWAFRQALLLNFSDVEDRFAFIDVEKAEAFNKHDEQMVKEAVRLSVDGGYAHCNTKVMDQMRTWVKHELHEMVIESIGMDLRSIGQCVSKSYVTENDCRLAQVVSVVFNRQGEFDAAMHLHREVIRLWTDEAWG